MNAICRHIHFLNIRLKSIKNKYFDKPVRIIEFTVLLIIYILMAVFLANRYIPSGYKQILGQFQTFTGIFLAYRFRYLGLTVGLLSNSVETCYIVYACIVSPSFFLFAGLTSKVLTIVFSIVMATFSNIQETQKEKLKEQKIKLELLSVTDDLTGVYNHRFFKSALDNEIYRANSSKSCVGLIIIDIDNFKMCNDINGHDFGDNILKGTASIIKQAVGDNSHVCRYGGDEFAVILPGLKLEPVNQIAHRIQSLYESQKHKYLNDSAYKNVTLSMGFSIYPDMAANKDDLINQADMALYHSKNLGKNSIHFYQDVLLSIKKSISSDNQHMIGVFKALLSTISAKDKYTLGHSERVSQYAVILGKALSLNLKDISMLQYAGLLHDIGKVEIPKLILSKNGVLSDDEYNLIRQHPIFSANILEPLSSMKQLIDYVIHHHERFDGSGYPHGIKGKSISLGARVLCIADSFDAMLSDRPYSKSMSMKEAFQELKRHSGSQFDPDLVDIFISEMKKTEEYQSAV